MKFRKIALSLCSFVGIVALAACGGGGGSTSGSGGTTGGGGGTTSTITTQSQATQSSSAASQSASLSTNVGQTVNNFSGLMGGAGLHAPQFRSPLAGGDTRFKGVHDAEAKVLRVPQAKLAAAYARARAAAAGSGAPTAISPVTSSCADGGTMTISGSYDSATGAADLSAQFSACKEGDERLNGTVRLTATQSTNGVATVTIKVGDGDGTLTSSDMVAELWTNNYTNLYAKLTTDLTLSGTTNAAGTAFTFTANGKESFDDFTETATLSLTNVSIASTLTSTTTSVSGTDTYNGTFSETWGSGLTQEGMTVAFTSFSNAWVDTSTYFENSANGTVALTTIPANRCFDGTFSIQTTTPVRVSYSTGLTTQGRMVINGNTVIVYNSDGSVDVTLNGGTPTHYANQYALDGVCVMADLQSNTATSSSGTGTVSGADALIATLTWDTYSDMDLHMNYYSTTTPTATTVGTNYVDWHHSSITGSLAAILDYDNTSGFGPEHISLTTLPAGYYVFSVNSFSGASSTNPTTVTVTVKIGSTLYSYTQSSAFTASDAEGTTAGAWYRVCDVQVDSTGTATVLAPNTALSPWHSGTFGFAPAQRAKGL